MSDDSVLMRNAATIGQVSWSQFLHLKKCGFRRIIGGPQLYSNVVITEASADSAGIWSWDNLLLLSSGTKRARPFDINISLLL